MPRTPLRGQAVEGGLPCLTAEACHPRHAEALAGTPVAGGAVPGTELGGRVSKPAGAPPSQAQSDGETGVNPPMTQTSCIIIR